MAQAYPRIDVTVDSVVFAYKPDKISVLLIKRKKNPFKDQWALPGGFVNAIESLDQAVYRELKEETGIEVHSLEQLYTFGEPKRDPRKHIISVAYYALIRQEGLEVRAADDATEAKWFNIKKLPKLAFDHKIILQTAIHRLRKKIFSEPIGLEILNKQFLFSELHTLYKTIHSQKINSRNIKMELLNLGIIEELPLKNKKSKSVINTYYRFNKNKYLKLKKSGMALKIVT